MENQPKLTSSKEIIAFLAERFPQCFTAEGEARPLKIGIFQDLVQRMQGDDSLALSKTQLRAALRRYTSSWRYLYSIKPGARRVDLDGNPGEELDASHVEHARQQLEEAKARLRQKREQQAQSAGDGQTGEKRKGPKSRPAPARKAAPRPDRNANAPASARPAHRASAPAAGRDAQPVRPVTDVSLLQVGQSIKVKAGKSVMDASIVEVTKDGVKVQLPSGLAMIVRAEHLRF